MNKKRLAYLFLIVCIGVAAYFIYDTYRIATGSKDQEEEGSITDVLNQDETRVEVKYKEYSIDKNLSHSLIVNEDGEVFVYLYENEVSCDTENVLADTNDDLYAKLDLGKIDLESLSGDDFELKSVNFYKRDPAGTYLVISAVPDTKNRVALKNEEGRVTGEVELVWKARSVVGKLDSTICENE